VGLGRCQAGMLGWGECGVSSALPVPGTDCRLAPDCCNPGGTAAVRLLCACLVQVCCGLDWWRGLHPLWLASLSE
jgi:hypothetical protein